MTCYSVTIRRILAFPTDFDEIPAIAPESNLAALRQICNGVSKQLKGRKYWAHITVTGMATAIRMDPPCTAAPLRLALRSIPALSP